jgi:predicted HD superfamily hydrolase involved in NAD metabolism
LSNPGSPSPSPSVAPIAFNRDAVLAWLETQVSPHRLAHILGVEATAKALAPLHALDPEAAATAGLLHDLAKFFSPARLLALAQAEGIPLDPVLEQVPHLLHAEISAVVARQEFHVHDPVILNAIRHHTLGCPGMAPLSCLIFVADAIEPQRGDDPALLALRRTSRKNLYKAVRKTCDIVFQHLLAQHKTIHPRLIETRNWALQWEKYGEK